MLTKTGKAPLVAANGASIPALGFGTWQLKGDVARQMVAEALKLGYRHVDTAQAYDNEAEVGQGLKAGGVPRDEYFLTTKVWTDRFRAGDLERSAEQSLKRLHVDHIDLLLLHWPNPEVPLAETIKALNAVRASGMTKHIGLSNFTVAQVREAVALSDAPLVTNQVEFHPLIDQSKLKAELDAQGMALTAYSPIAQGRVNDAPAIKAIAEAHRKSPPQVTLRWALQLDGVIAIPRSSKIERVRDNFDVFDFTLSEEEMATISLLGTREGRITSPAWAPVWD
ncbi:aldo/keto reductase [Methylopila sp. 73B]|uniref:aldo/keto reductase n=1 Tax=Methylopila sp. 73B TaxID=1120792 RepID=UPI000360ED41|nr:aldo/keto reductase [Methylopila sp. 73B]